MEISTGYITYEEAANILGIVPTSVYKLVSEGRLHSIKVPGTHRKKLNRSDVEAYGNGRSVQQSVQVNSIPSLETLEQSVPVTSIQDILKLVNEGFSSISSDHEKIAEQYKATVSPIINHVVSAPEQSFIAELSQAMQTMLNNVIVMIKTPNIGDASPETVVDMMMREIKLPPQLKEMLYEIANKLQQHANNSPRDTIAA